VVRYLKQSRATFPISTETRPTSEISQKSIAVLPFVNMSADKNDEYLSDGMTEELLNVLTKVKSLHVPGRSSSFAFKGKNEEDIFRKVGEQLHVNAVLEGSVRKAGEKLRITAQLINVADGFHLWSETYDGDMKDILAVQSDVARRVVEALQVQLGVDEAGALAKKSTENPEAHRLYLLGRYHFTKATRADWASAIQYFEQALQIDPGFALAYCGPRSESCRSPPGHGHSSLQHNEPARFRERTRPRRAIEPQAGSDLRSIWLDLRRNGPFRRRGRGRKEGVGTRSAKYFTEYEPRFLSLLEA
jgi:TolB-like protein